MSFPSCCSSSSQPNFWELCPLLTSFPSRVIAPLPHSGSCLISMEGLSTGHQRFLVVEPSQQCVTLLTRPSIVLLAATFLFSLNLKGSYFSQRTVFLGLWLWPSSSHCARTFWKLHPCLWLPWPGGKDLPPFPLIQAPHPLCCRLGACCCRHMISHLFLTHHSPFILFWVWSF